MDPTYLRALDDPQLARCGAVAGERADGHLCRLEERVLRRDPVADLVRDDLDNRHAGVVLVTLYMKYVSTVR
jgi:hypothetical protein